MSFDEAKKNSFFFFNKGGLCYILRCQELVFKSLVCYFVLFKKFK